MSSCNVKLDNIGGVLFVGAQKSKIREPRFKPEFISQIPRLNNYSNTSWAILRMYKAGTAMKCACCDSSTAYFMFHKENGRVIFRPFVDTVGHGRQRLTVDHDKLKSLGGSNEINNYNLLCDACNQLRGSSFSRYKEFKEWYDAQPKVNGKVMKKPEPTFCFVNFESNTYVGEFMKMIEGAKTLPPSVTGPTIHSFRTGKNDPFCKLSIKMWLLIDREFANRFLNELVWERVYNGRGIKHVTVRNHDFFNHNLVDHRKIKLHIENEIKKEFKTMQKIHNTWLLMKEDKTVVPEPVSEIKEEVQEVVKTSLLKGMFERLFKIFA